MIMWADRPNEDVPASVLDELNRQLAAVTHAHNTAPDPTMGGLSPDQVTRLLYSEWGAAASPIRFNTDIPLVELTTSAFFRESLTLLKAVHESGGVRATASGKLPRAFVSTLLPLMYDADTCAEMHRYRKAFNEQDLQPLHIARVVAQLAGLLRLQKGKFTLPLASQSLLSDTRAGELYRSLFVAFFRKLNLAYVHPFAVEAKGLQTCIGYTLYRLGQAASNWLDVDAFPEQALLPTVRDEIAAGIHGHVYWTVSRVATDRLVSPLIQWGLLEGRYEPASHSSELKAIRVTPLYTAFLRFDLQP